MASGDQNVAAKAAKNLPNESVADHEPEIKPKEQKLLYESMETENSFNGQTAVIKKSGDKKTEEKDKEEMFLERHADYETQRHNEHIQMEKVMGYQVKNFFRSTISSLALNIHT